MNTELTPLKTTSEAVDANSYDVATNEAEWDSPERAQRLVESHISDGSVVLDIGIGTGQAVRGYAEKGAAIIGLDYDQEMLATAQLVTGESGSMRLSDINGLLPIDDIQGKVDVAQAIGVLEFANDLANVTEQVKSSLKPGGLFVFTVETPAYPTDELVKQYPDVGLTIYRHTADEVREMLSGMNFSLIHDEAYGGYSRGDTTTDKVPYHIFLAQK